VFPCRLKYLPECTFRNKDPIVIGVDVVEGQLRVNTPLVIPSRDVRASSFVDALNDCWRQMLHIGHVIGIENNHKEVEIARAGSSVAVKIQPTSSNPTLMAGRHFFEGDEILSLVRATPCLVCCVPTLIAPRRSRVRQSICLNCTIATT